MLPISLAGQLVYTLLTPVIWVAVLLKAVLGVLWSVLVFIPNLVIKVRPTANLKCRCLGLVPHAHHICPNHDRAR